MKKVYILWPQKSYSLEERKVKILAVCDQLKTLDTKEITANIDDEFSTVKSPAPKFYRGPAMVGMVSITADDASVFDVSERSLEEAGFKVGCYVVHESKYKDYGDNQHAKPRHWPDGEKTPEVVVAVTLLTRPKRYNMDEWIRRWHGVMSPGSEVIQPRARYVRNVVLSVEKGLSFDGIVEESWPSAEHISDPYKFYLATNMLQLIGRMITMLRLVTHFHQLHKIRTVTMSEYFIKTDFNS